MKLFKFPCAILLFMLVTFAGVMSAQSLVEKHARVSVTDSLNGQDTSKVGSVDVFKIVDGFLQNFPSDLDVSSTDFTAVLGAQTAQVLQMMGATHISNHGGVLKLTLQKPFEHDLGKKADIKLDQECSFRYERQPGTVKITAVHGIQVKVNWFLGWMDFKAVKLASDSAGNTVVDATVHTLWKDRDYHTVLGPDGKPLPAPKTR
jgi:hypothetical protein